MPGGLGCSGWSLFPSVSRMCWFAVLDAECVSTMSKCKQHVFCWITWHSVGTACRTVGLSCQYALSVSPSPFTLWHYILSSDCAPVLLCLFPKSFPFIFGILVFLHVAQNEKFNIDQNYDYDWENDWFLPASAATGHQIPTLLLSVYNAHYKMIKSFWTCVMLRNIDFTLFLSWWHSASWTAGGVLVAGPQRVTICPSNLVRACVYKTCNIPWSWFDPARGRRIYGGSCYVMFTPLHDILHFCIVHHLVDHVNCTDEISLSLGQNCRSRI